MSEKILFMCPHAAAKSLIAAGYFEKQAKSAGLDVSISTAGTDPDPAPYPSVIEHLSQFGIDISDHVPARFTTKQLQSADRVVSIGCDTSEIAPYAKNLESWDEVPMLSDDFYGTCAAIGVRVEALVDELKRS